ncbi:MAG TPA: Sec-independent protein translocase protein TatB [Jatrophihabitans sp.]|jgi:sec-independent protein translocase protein TatB|uniref:Sec-independent protein translocase protein TatB n=1 Tax=Jatrophihabitans sp. TaxID=1932789 RepID=UPI002DF831C0|nr:Sec-independent protein translocase protein TatB [Jatrophihabitans sp.]
MFNIGPMELMVLAIVGLVVLGPDRLPGLAREAAQLIRTLRELATGARQQLRDELGPEFADVDLRNLNPRTVVSRAVLGEDFNLSKLNPRTAVRDAIFGDEDLKAADPRTVMRDVGDEIRGRHSPNGAGPVDSPVTMTKPVSQPMSPPAAASPPAPRAPGERPRPRPRPAAPPPPATPYDADAT